MLGAFRSFGLTIASGLAIGMTQSLILYLSTKSWFPQSGGSALPGLGQTLPFVVIAVALFLRGSSLPQRGALTTVRLPFAPEPRGLLPRFVLCGAVALVALFIWKQARYPTGHEAVLTDDPGIAPAWRTRAYWLAASFVPSALMLSVTNHLSLNIGSVPFVALTVGGARHSFLGDSQGALSCCDFRKAFL